MSSTHRDLLFWMRPVFAAVTRSAGARDEMEATRLIAALVAQRTCLAEVAAIKQPHACECNPFIDESLDEALQDDAWRSFLGERERDVLQRLQLHGEASLHEISLQDRQTR